MNATEMLAALPAQIVSVAEEAAQLLHIFEAQYPNDQRPRLAVQAALSAMQGGQDGQQALRSAAADANLASGSKGAGLGAAWAAAEMAGFVASAAADALHAIATAEAMARRGCRCAPADTAISKIDDAYAALRNARASGALASGEYALVSDRGLVALHHRSAHVSTHDCYIDAVGALVRSLA